jgi:hypothetical protein
MGGAYRHHHGGDVLSHRLDEVFRLTAQIATARNKVLFQ